MDALLKVEDIHKIYDNKHVLDGISFDMAKGETKVIIGPSGTGKSTLLRCVNRLSEPDQGKIILDGVTVLDKSVAHPPKVNINSIRFQSRVFQLFIERLYSLFLYSQSQHKAIIHSFIK